jgi:hypothetical protein
VSILVQHFAKLLALQFGEMQDVTRHGRAARYYGRAFAERSGGACAGLGRVGHGRALFAGSGSKWGCERNTLAELTTLIDER